MDKLQELTQKLYEEGLAKGKQDGEALLQKAQAEAEGIVKQAQEEGKVSPRENRTAKPFSRKPSPRPKAS